MMLVKSTIPRSLLLAAAILAALPSCPAQLPSAPTQGVASQPPSSLVQPALDFLVRTGSSVDLNRWKGPAAGRDEVDANLASIQRDVQTTLPPLLAAADAAPASAAASLPLLLNLDALYSVLLRVSLAGRTGAPRNEATALEQAAQLLDSARRDLGNAVLASAKRTEQRVSELQAAAAQQAPVAPIPMPAKVTTTARSKKKAAGSGAR